MDMSEEKMRDLVKARLEAALLKKKMAKGLNYSQKQWANELGFRSDTTLSDLLNGYTIPRGKTLQALANDPDVGFGIYDDVGLDRPMPRDAQIRKVVDRMEGMAPAERLVIAEISDMSQDELKEAKETLLAIRRRKRDKSNAGGV
jgi:hypothetical protein